MARPVETERTVPSIRLEAADAISIRVTKRIGKVSICKCSLAKRIDLPAIDGVYNVHVLPTAVLIARPSCLNTGCYFYFVCSSSKLK